VLSLILVRASIEFFLIELVENGVNNAVLRQK